MMLKAKYNYWEGTDLVDNIVLLDMFITLFVIIKSKLQNPFLIGIGIELRRKHCSKTFDNWYTVNYGKCSRPWLLKVDLCKSHEHGSIKIDSNLFRHIDFLDFFLLVFFISIRCREHTRQKSEWIWYIWAYDGIL